MPRNVRVPILRDSVRMPRARCVRVILARALATQN